MRLFVGWVEEGEDVVGGGDTKDWMGVSEWREEDNMTRYLDQTVFFPRRHETYLRVARGRQHQERRRR